MRKDKNPCWKSRHSADHCCLLRYEAQLQKLSKERLGCSVKIAVNSAATIAEACPVGIKQRRACERYSTPFSEYTFNRLRHRPSHRDGPHVDRLERPLVDPTNLVVARETVHLTEIVFDAVVNGTSKRSLETMHY